jgi:ribosomal protein S3
LKGYYIRVKGRFKRGRRKATFLRRQGFIAFNSLNLKLDSHYGLLYTRFGIAGIKIIFSY